MSTLAFDPDETTDWEQMRPREIPPQQRKRFDGYAAEIFKPSARTCTRFRP